MSEGLSCVARKFIKLKERKGTGHHTEVVRTIINEAYDQAKAIVKEDKCSDLSPSA